MRVRAMVYVYLIESARHSRLHYVGVTKDLKRRMIEHNSGSSPHTAKFKPWNLVLYLGFADEPVGYAFEQYLKSGSGKTFLKRHFLRRAVIERAGPMTLSPRHRV